MREILGEFADARSPIQAAAVRRNGQLVEAVKYLRVMRDSNSEGMVPLPDDIDGVRLSTIHGAKGLEWPHVILAACVNGKMPGRRRPDALELPSEFLDYDVDPATAHLDEERHLFYVGITRAKESLTFTYARHYPGNKDSTVRKRSPFFDDIDAGLVEQVDAPSTQLRAAQPRRFPIRPDKGPLKLSYSSLQAFKKCERDYEYRAIWGVPQISSPDARLGTLIHSVLCDAMRLREQGHVVDPDFVLKLWDTKWRTEANELQKQPELHERGASMLRRYVVSDAFSKATIWMYQQRDAQGQAVGKPKPMLEFPFKIALDGDVSLVGRFDRVDSRDGKPVVVDYKTGKPRTVDQLRRDDQLKLYANAIIDMLGVEEVVCQIHWLQSGEIGEVTFTKKELDRARAATAELAQQVQKRHFSGRSLPANPNSWNCGTCPYRLVCDQGRDLTGDSLGL